MKYESKFFIIFDGDIVLGLGSLSMDRGSDPWRPGWRRVAGRRHHEDCWLRAPADAMHSGNRGVLRAPGAPLCIPLAWQGSRRSAWNGAAPSCPCRSNRGHGAVGRGRLGAPGVPSCILVVRRAPLAGLDGGQQPGGRQGGMGHVVSGGWLSWMVYMWTM